MDASRISMARLLAYLFEVTERFGMETRTDLILLQRTMVVVEGVARSLDPHINIWEVARPIVETYVRKSIGPQAILRDLLQTARVLSRFGPRLPGLVEAQLIRIGNPAPLAAAKARRLHPAIWVGLTLAAFAAGIGLGEFL
jgi:ubiquinone biosynthesis protein